VGSTYWNMSSTTLSQDSSIYFVHTMDFCGKQLVAEWSGLLISSFSHIDHHLITENQGRGPAGQGVRYWPSVPKVWYLRLATSRLDLSASYPQFSGYNSVDEGNTVPSPWILDYSKMYTVSLGHHWK
jgi:hypothetical protein